MADPLLTVVCVLRSGPEYRVEHVVALANGVRRNLSLPYRFICLTDRVAGVRAAGIEPIDLLHDWPGWWSKCEMFRPDLFTGPCWYADLDTVIVGPLDDIVLGHHFTVLRSFWAEDYKEPDRIGSGLMAWDCDLSDLYRTFLAAPAYYMGLYATKLRWGDQSFIKDRTPVEPERWQAKHPGRVVSYKKHVRPTGCVPGGASVVAFHGRPRPWHTPLWRQL